MSYSEEKTLKAHVKRGDEVEILSGSERGKKGKVLQVILKKQRIIVEGLHMISKSSRPSQTNQKGGIEQREGTVHVSNVRLVTAAKEVPSKKSKE